MSTSRRGPGRPKKEDDYIGGKEMKKVKLEDGTRPKLEEDYENGDSFSNSGHSEQMNYQSTFFILRLSLKDYKRIMILTNISLQDGLLQH